MMAMIVIYSTAIVRTSTTYDFAEFKIETQINKRKNQRKNRDYGISFQ